jgi:rod shape-determining protein MreC
VVLVLVSLALVTIYFRESSDGSLHAAQRIGLSALAPFQVAGERIARPFRDAYGWASDLFGAKAENERLRQQVETLRNQAIANATAAGENEQLRSLLDVRDGPSFPEDYESVTTRVISRSPNPYSQRVLVAAGSNDGIARNDPVMTEDGLIGLVTEVTPSVSQVTLLIDPNIAVSAVVLGSGAAGIVRRGPSDDASLILDRVDKAAVVNEGDTVLTAGSEIGKIASLYPPGLPIGRVTGVGQRDVDLYKQIQVTPRVDFDSLSLVMVLVPRARAGSP